MTDACSVFDCVESLRERWRSWLECCGDPVTVTAGDIVQGVQISIPSQYWLAAMEIDVSSYLWGGPEDLDPEVIQTIDLMARDLGTDQEAMRSVYVLCEYSVHGCDMRLWHEDPDLVVEKVRTEMNRHQEQQP